MKYSFSVASVGGSDVRNITSVLSAANAANGGLGTFKATIPSDAMEPGSAFEVSLQANNFLGYADAAYSDTSSAGNLFKLGNPAPVIRIQGKNPVTSATHSSALQLQASAALPKMTCVPSSLANSKMSFQWTEVSGKLGLSSSDLSSSSKNPRVVNIKEELLAATETYTFQVVGFMDSNPSVNNSAVVEVVVGQQDLVAGIGGRGASSAKWGAAAPSRWTAAARTTRTRTQAPPLRTRGRALKWTRAFLAASRGQWI